MALRLPAVPLFQRPAEERGGRGVPPPGGQEENLSMGRQLQRLPQLPRRGEPPQEAHPSRVPVSQQARQALDAGGKPAVLHHHKRPPLGPDASRQAADPEQRRARPRRPGPGAPEGAPLKPLLGPLQPGGHRLLIGQGQKAPYFVHFKQLRHRYVSSFPRSRSALSGAVPGPPAVFRHVYRNPRKQMRPLYPPNCCRYLGGLP